MDFKKVCIYCGRPNYSSNYICRCRPEKWYQEYRTLDLDMEGEKAGEAIRDSFHAYSFDHPDGMLQYEGLPFQHYKPPYMEAAGLTPLYELDGLGDTYGCRIFLKNEGNNPSGCFKDRESVMCFLNSKSRGLNHSVIYSSGNAAASAAALVENTGHHLITFVAGDTYPEKIDYIRDHGADVVVIGDKQTNFEAGYRLYSRMNALGVFAHSGFDDWSVRNPFRVQGDKTIAVEIVKQLKNSEKLSPDYILVPTANGSCLAGIWKGLKELKEAGIISTLPRMIAAGIKNASPVARAARQGKTEVPVRCDLSEVASEDAEVGSIILAEEGYDSVEAAKAVIESGGMAVELHKNDIKESLIDFLETEGELAVEQEILPEPAAVTSLAAIEKVKEQLSLSSDDVLVPVSTGHGLKAEKVIRALLSGRDDLQKKVQKIMNKREHHMRDPSETQGQKIQVEANVEAVRHAFFQLQRLPA